MKKRLLNLLLLLSLFTVSFAFSVSASYFSASSTVTTEGGRLNVRETASLSSKVIATLSNGKNLSVYAKKGEWYKVEYKKGEFGFCHESYLTENESSYRAYVNTDGGSLNVRRGSNTGYEIKDKLSDGALVTVISEGNSFHKIIYNGTKTGFVSKDFLLKAPLYHKKTTLSVPSYKQTDVAWKNLPIGTRGDTIGTIGCTTTALSMTESHRTGKAITPDIMRNRLTYTTSGSLYWPGNYVTELVTGGDYLRKIHKVLSEGKPVILGAKSYGGKQHWVVVTAYGKNTAELFESRFLINDPGSKSRVTLKDFIEDYQNVYKIAYYK